MEQDGVPIFLWLIEVPLHDGRNVRRYFGAHDGGDIEVLSRWSGMSAVRTVEPDEGPEQLARVRLSTVAGKIREGA